MVFSRIQPNIRKYFLKIFLKCNQTHENIFFSGKQHFQKISIFRKYFYTNQTQPSYQTQSTMVIKSPFSPKQLVRPKSSNRLHQPSPLIARCSAVSKSEGPTTLVRSKSKTTQIRSSSMNNPADGNTNIKTPDQILFTILN